MEKSNKSAQSNVIGIKIIWDKHQLCQPFEKLGIVQDGFYPKLVVVPSVVGDGGQSLRNAQCVFHHNFALLYTQ